MTKRLSVIGLGKLGLCTMACLAGAGYRVIGMDSDENHIVDLNSGKINNPEPGLIDILKAGDPDIRFTSDIDYAVTDSEISFIIVPTPSNGDGAFSNRYIMDVFTKAAPVIKKKSGYHLINIVSTVMPGSFDNEFIPFIEKITGKRVGREIGLTYNPEFIALGSVIENFLNPDLVLIGESDQKSGNLLAEIYSNVCHNTPSIQQTSIPNAEIVKLAINCFCTMKISFANQIGAICDRVQGTNASEICTILGHDTRIGHKYIKPGLGFGGPCFPRDNEAFIRFTKDAVDKESSLQKAVIDINNEQIKRVADKIIAVCGDKKRKIALLGAAYKPGTSVTERSQALDIINYLTENYPELRVSVYDPQALTKGRWETAETLKDCVKNADIAAVLTPWPEFLSVPWQAWMAEEHTILNFWE